jgi:dTDP-4-amino-4,6-dideoxygalactose transaminase
MRASFLSFSPPDLGADELDEVIDTLRSDWITTGPKTKRFEDEFAAYVGAPAGAAVNSCTAATMVALAALGIGPGDAVFTTTLTFVSTVHVIEHVGATPILVDIDPATLNLNPKCLEDAMAEAAAKGLTSKAIIPVHYAGLPCDMRAIMEFARAHKLAVVEDAAHSLPAQYDGRMIGAIDADVPHAVAFSFYATKNLTTGEGGMLTGSADLIDEARLWILHGMSRDAWKRYGKGGSWFYEVIRPGFKCNMTDMAAAIGLVQLGRLNGLHQKRVNISAYYDEALAGLPLIVAPNEASSVHARHLYPIRLHLDALTIDRSRFIDELTERNIGSSVHFIPVHNHPYYRDRYGYEIDQFPEAQRAFNALVSLPLNTRMTEEDAADVVEAVRDIVTKFSR